MQLPDFVEMLRTMLYDRARRTDTLRAFEEALCECADEGPAWEILRELLWDLSYFVDDVTKRSEDSNYFGHERFEHEIATALEKLQRLGATTDAIP